LAGISIDRKPAPIEVIISRFTYDHYSIGTNFLSRLFPANLFTILNAF